MKRHYKFLAILFSIATVFVACEDNDAVEANQKLRLEAPAEFTAKFNEITPINGEIILNWGMSDGASGYTIALYKGNVNINKATFNEENFVAKYQIEGTNYILTELDTDVTTYYAYIQAISTDANYRSSSWTTVHFSPVYNAPIIPQANIEALAVGQNITMTWTLEGATPTKIIIKLEDGTEVQTKKLTSNEIENAEVLIEGLNAYTIYMVELASEDYSYGSVSVITYPIFKLTAEQESEENGTTIVVNWTLNEDFAPTHITALPVGGTEAEHLTKVILDGTETSVTFEKLTQQNWNYIFTIYVGDIACGTITAKTGEATTNTVQTIVETNQNLADAITKAEKGSVILIADGINTATTGVISIDKDVIIKAIDGASPIFENVYFTVNNADLELIGITCKNIIDVVAFVTIDGDVASLKLTNTIIDNAALTGRLIQFNATTVKEFTVNNCIISNIVAPSELIDFAVAVDKINILNSTFSECASGTTYLIDLNGAVGDMLIDANTFVNITNRGIRFRSTRLSFALTNNIYANNTGVDNRILYSTTNDKPSTCINNFAFGYGANRITDGINLSETDIFTSWTSVNGIYKINTGIITTAAGDPEGR